MSMESGMLFGGSIGAVCCGLAFGGIGYLCDSTMDYKNRPIAKVGVSAGILYGARWGSAIGLLGSYVTEFLGVDKAIDMSLVFAFSFFAMSSGLMAAYQVCKSLHNYITKDATEDLGKLDIAFVGLASISTAAITSSFVYTGLKYTALICSL